MQVVGLILLAALQRRRRGIHISAMLRPKAQPAHTTMAELQAVRGISAPGGRTAAGEVPLPAPSVAHPRLVSREKAERRQAGRQAGRQANANARLHMHRC